MNNRIRLLLVAVGLFLLAAPYASLAWNLDPIRSTLQDTTIQPRLASAGGDSLQSIVGGWISVLQTIKVIIASVAFIYIIYLGVMLILAQGNETEITKQKKQLYYTFIAFVFINIPGKIYELFWDKNFWDVTSRVSGSSFFNVQSGGSNIFVNFDAWDSTVTWGIVMFIRVAIIGFAILMFILAALQLILSRGEEEAKKKVKGRFISGVFALLFVGIIETWIRVVYKGSISQGQHLFSQLINLAIFFAGPLVIFFLILAGYYYITSAGDDAKIKKAKAILVNTVIAVLILFACYSFLIDLSKFSLT